MCQSPEMAGGISLDRLFRLRVSRRHRLATGSLTAVRSRRSTAALTRVTRPATTGSTMTRRVHSNYSSLITSQCHSLGYYYILRFSIVIGILPSSRKDCSFREINTC
jgi:hypothetical protein